MTIGTEGVGSAKRRDVFDYPHLLIKTARGLWTETTVEWVDPQGGSVVLLDVSKVEFLSEVDQPTRARVTFDFPRIVEVAE